MKYTIQQTTEFRRSYKRVAKRGYDTDKLWEIVAMLADGQTLPDRCHDHALEDSRDFKQARECHIEPDWLLVYRIAKGTLVLALMRTGSHSDIFGR